MGAEGAPGAEGAVGVKGVVAAASTSGASANKAKMARLRIHRSFFIGQFFIRVFNFNRQFSSRRVPRRFGLSGSRPMPFPELSPARKESFKKNEKVLLFCCFSQTAGRKPA